MSEKLLVEIVTKSDKAVKELEKVNEQAGGIKDKLGDIGKSGEESVSGIKKLSKGISGVGLAIKAAGIGLLLQGLTFLKDLLMQNQVVVDGFSTAFNFLSVIFGEVANAIKTVYENVSQSTENFDAMGRVIGNVMTIAITPMLLSFQAIKGALLGAQLAWEGSFLGGKDPEKIESLKAQLAEVGDKIVDIGSDAIKAGAGIVEDFGEAVSEVGDISKQVVTEVKKISVESALETAKGMTQLEKDARLAEARSQGVLESYNNQIEKLRQTRDDERLSIEDRKKANEELAVKLTEQEEALTALAERRLAQAEQNLALQPMNLEFLEAKIAAENELAAVEAAATGFRTEQIMAEVALERELADIKSIKAQTELDVSRVTAEAEAERSGSELLALEMSLSRIDKERDAEIQLLKDKQALYAENSVSYQEMQGQIDVVNETAKQAELTLEKQIQQQKLGLAMETLGSLKTALGENTKAGKALGIAEAVINTYVGATAALKNPFPLNIVALAGTLAAGFASVKSIIAVDETGESSVGDGGGGASAPAMVGPSVNIAGGGTDASTQLLSAVEKNTSSPSKAYVVGTEVTSQQAMDRRVEENATI
jgi:hypothetical protein